MLDAKTKEPVPFATIKTGNNGHGMVAGLNGKFEIPGQELAGVRYLEISCLGYKPLSIPLPFTGGPVLYLQPDAEYLEGVVIRPPYEKMRRILNNAIANKGANNPDKYDWYRCHVYYKMIADATLPDSVINDTAKDNREVKEYLGNQHLLMSETYSIRTWRAPQQLQEEVVATRFSGLKKSMFTSMVTDILPFHGYNDYITLNGKDYHNPVSRGFEQYYLFSLTDEIIQGNDTIWALSFRPKGLRANNMTGVVYINSDKYAISRLVARANDSMLKMNVRLEQQYEEVVLNDSDKRWFPKHLNYVIDWDQKSGGTVMTLHMKGNSLIDSVSFGEDPDFRFDKSHTIKLSKRADEADDEIWNRLRPEQLTAKEKLTYKFTDSIGQTYHIDRYLNYLSKLPEGKVPVGPFDVELKRIFSYNHYEQIRLGLGIQTNENLVKWLSAGGWGGYGFGDRQWKYGAFAEVYADRYKEFVFKAGYTDDIIEPGRIHLDRELDKNYLKTYLLNRVDEIKAYTFSVRRKTGYWNFEMAGSQQEIIPKYLYALDHKGIELTTFTAKEASLLFRYAFAERTAPFFGYYTRTGCRYPILYGKITTGSVESGSVEMPYTQVVTAVQWHKHINRLGFEHILVEGGKLWSSDQLPLNKLFAGNGFRYDDKSGTSIYAFGGMLTMYPYAYYTDQFVNVVLRHDFDWKLFKLEEPDFIYSSAPNICLQYGLLYGTLSHPEAQKYVAFSVPDNGYQEVGLLLNNIFRVRYLNLYYLTLNMGYFYHVTPEYSDKNGRVVFGAGVEL